MPDSVTSIGSGAFSGCSSLVSITLPFVGSNAEATSASSSTLFGYIFGTSNYTGGTLTTQYYASGSFNRYYIPTTLTNVTITGGSILYGAFYNCDMLKNVTIGDGVKTIDCKSFYKCTSLTSIVIGDNVTIIGEESFYYCTSLESVTIGDSVETISEYAFYQCALLTYVVMGGGLKTISDNAFYRCASLISIVIPDSVTTIGSESFYYCTSLESVTIGSGVETIGDSAFYNCNSLISVTMGESVTTISDQAFVCCESLTSITIGSSVKSIGHSAFVNCTALTEINFNATEMADLSSNNYIFAYAGQSGDGITVTIGANVTNIPAYLFCPHYISMFDGSPNITSVVFEDNSKCESIGDYAFYNCASLISITIPDSVSFIGSDVLYGCSSLVSITLPFVGASAEATSASSSTLFGYLFGTSGYAGSMQEYQYYSDDSYVIYYVPLSLSSVTITGGNILYGAFSDCPMITNVIIGDNVTIIDERAFVWCESLTSVTIGSGVTSIGNYAFAYCTSLTGITIPDSVVSIGFESFYNCTSLESITIGNGVKSIGDYAFYNCTSLTSVIIPDGITFIGYETFRDCASLTSVTIPGSVTSIELYAFYNCTSLTRVYFGGTASQWASIAFGNLDANPLYYAGNLYLNEALVADITIEDITAINDYAFYNCASLESVIIDNNVTSVGEHAFFDCVSLTSITIGSNITSIGYEAFYNCVALTEINFNATALDDLSLNDRVFYKAGQNGNGIAVTVGANVTKIPAYLFCGVNYISSVVFKDNSVCTSIGDYAFYNNTLYKSLIIPNSVTSIGEYTFYNCSSLTSVTIGSSVKSIGDAAFGSCAALTEINFNATAMDDFSSSSDVFYYAGQSSNGIAVTVGVNVTKIPAYLFYPYSSNTSPNITSVVFEDGSVCTSIGEYAFYNCSSLTYLTIGSGVKLIGDRAFYNCNALTEINFNATAMDDFSSDNYVFNNAGKSGNGITVTIGASVTKIPAYLFCYNSSYITSVVFEDNSVCESIGNFAFYWCPSLTSIAIPDSVTSIGDRAFYGCTSLKYLTIGSGVTSIGNYAFYNCIALAEINFNATAMGDLSSTNNVFYKAGQSGDGITVTIGANVTKIPACLFYSFHSTIYEDSIIYAPKITSVIFEDNSVCASIGNYAFEYCIEFTSIEIPDSVKTICNSAFEYCTSLISVTLGNSVETIDSSAFANCTSLESVYYNGTVSEWASISFGTYDANPLYYASNLYLEGTLATEITIEDITDINAVAFSGCTSLTSVTIGSGVETIGASAFSGCTSLASVTIGSDVTSIGTSAFYNCTALAEINFNATAMDDLSSSNYVFSCAGQNGDGITVTIGANVIKIPAYLFCSRSSSSYAPNITSVIFEDGSVCSSIGSSAFANCTSLGSVYYNGTVSEWASISFGTYDANPLYYAGNLYLEGTLATEITIEDITDINAVAFSGCTSLTSITIGSGVETIGEDAFSGCTSLTSVTIGSGVETIGEDAFSGCTSLASVTIGSGVTSIGSSAFYYCTALTEINFNATAMDDLSSTNNVFYKAGQNGDGITVTIGANVTKIPAYLFSSYYITNVTFEENSVCTSIGEHAFYYCDSLKNVTIGDNVTSIGNYAFYNCTALTKINFNATAMEDLSSYNNVFAYAGQSGSGITVTIGANVTKIPAYLFEPSSYLSSGYAPNITSVIFEDGSVCESIGNYAFYNCTSLISIIIPVSVTSIGRGAFYNCIALAEINFNATAMGDLSSTNNVFYKAGQSGDGIVVTIGANVTKIPAYLFYSDILSTSPNITSVMFENSSACKSIGNYAFYNCTSLISITLPNGVKSIGDFAFRYCTSLESVTISSGVTSIGDSAFYYCTSLTSITMPDSVTSIGSSAFDYCYRLVEVYNLSSLTITAGSSSNGYVGYYAININTSTNVESRLFEYENFTFVYDKNYNYYLVCYNGTETDITLPDLQINGTSVNYEINQYAFYDSASLTSIIIDKDVTSIGSYAFDYCTSLTSVAIGSSVKSIGDFAFRYCTSLESVTISSGVTSIGDSAFYYCTSLTSITMPDSVTSIGSSAFSGCTSLASITIGSNVTSIGNYAFYNCTSLTSITVSSGNTTYKSVDGNLYSYDGTELVQYAIGKTDTSFEVPDSVTSIGSSAFYNCTSLVSITIGSNVTSIGNSAFSGCTSLASITIGSNVTSIGNYAFSGCTSLESVTIPDSVTSIIGRFAFFNCTSLTSITVSSGNTTYKSIDGNLYSYDGTELIQYAIGKTDTSFEVPDSVTSIGGYAFYNCTSLTSITIPDSVTSIGDDAFSYCTSLISITIGDSVTSIGSYAFWYCTSLTSVTV